jgi:hypothetical protein
VGASAAPRSSRTVIQLGEPVQRREWHEDDEQQDDADDAAFSGDAGEKGT